MLENLLKLCHLYQNEEFEHFEYQEKNNWIKVDAIETKAKITHIICCILR